MLLHVSRGVRWDSDHVVSLADASKAIVEELIRGDFLAAHLYRARFLRREYQPHRRLGDRNSECHRGAPACAARSDLDTAGVGATGDYTSRLALLEEAKTLPGGAVWDDYRRRQNVPVGARWLEDIESY